LFTLYKKEVADYFSSFIGYACIGLFLLFTGLLLWVFPDTSILGYGYADLRNFFSIVPYVLMFLVPAVTMRTIAGEKNDGTFDLLMTWPLSAWQIIMAKFAGCLSIIILAILPTLLYYFSVYQLGNPIGNIDSGAVCGSFIGLILLSCGFISLGLLTSILSRNVIVAFLLAAFLCYFTFIGLLSLSQMMVSGFLSNFFASLALATHYDAISRGVADTRDLIYFLSFNVIILLLCKNSLGSGE